LGKFIGGMITLAVPIAMGFLMVSLILELSPAVELAGDDWGRISLMLVISLVMVSVMLNLGLFLSSMTKRSADTLMLLLFLWIVFLFVIPNGSVYLSAQIRPIESRKKADSQVQEIWGRFQREKASFRDSIPTHGLAIQSDDKEPWGGYTRFATRSLVRRNQKYYAFVEPLRIRYAHDAWQVTRRYLESMKQQKRLANLISMVSPISLYETLITSLSRTHVSDFDRFAHAAGEYRQQIIDYLYSVKAFSSIRYFATIKEEHLFEVYGSDPEKPFDGFDEFGTLKERYDISAPSPMNVSDISQFRYHPERAADTMKRILPELALLCFVSVFLFMCAFAAFLRCEVR